MAPFSRVISPILGDKLDTSIMNGIGLCFSCNRYLTLDKNVPSLHIILLPKLPSVDFPNAFFTIMVFYTAWLLFKDLASQQMKCSGGLMLMNSPVLLCSLSYKAGGLIEW